MPYKAIPGPLIYAKMEDYYKKALGLAFRFRPML